MSDRKIPTGMDPIPHFTMQITDRLQHTKMSDTNTEFASPTETFSPETEHVDLHAADIHSDGVGEDRNVE